MNQTPFQNTPDPELPPVFCVEYMKDNRNGYAYIEYSIVISDEGQRVYVLRPKNHTSNFFRIINNREYVLEHQTIWKSNISRKPSGRINRPMRWRNTGEALRHNNIDYPILRIANSSLVLPIIHIWSFIPIRQNIPTVDPIPLNQPALEEKMYEIIKIPQHTIRALLRDAAMQEEVCPITGDDIDIRNGAVTSCFHLFDKNAITTWINMPNSQNKCPLCNIECKVNLLEEN
jgi:hypothetical protein